MKAPMSSKTISITWISNTLFIIIPEGDSVDEGEGAGDVEGVVELIRFAQPHATRTSASSGQSCLLYVVPCAISDLLSFIC